MTAFPVFLGTLLFALTAGVLSIAASLIKLNDMIELQIDMEKNR